MSQWSSYTQLTRTDNVKLHQNIIWSLHCYLYVSKWLVVKYKLARTDTNWVKTHLSANTGDGACRRMPWETKKKNEGILCLVAHKGNVRTERSLILVWGAEQSKLGIILHKEKTCAKTRDNFLQLWLADNSWWCIGFSVTKARSHQMPYFQI